MFRVACWIPVLTSQTSVVPPWQAAASNLPSGEKSIDVGLPGKPCITLISVAPATSQSRMELSSLLETDINLPFIASDGEGPKHLTSVVSREELEEMVSSLVERVTERIVRAFYPTNPAACGIW